MKVYIGRYPKNSNKERKISVRIDKHDTWSMDNTLAYIILPMLKQLKETKHGSPFVDMEDVPEHLRTTEKDEYGTDVTHHQRWDYVMDEMIFAFQSKLIDWEDQFWKVKPEIDYTPHAEDEGKEAVPLRWKVEGQCDWDGMREYQARITNGFRLFGKYYEGLWD